MKFTNNIFTFCSNNRRHQTEVTQLDLSTPHTGTIYKNGILKNSI